MARDNAVQSVVGQVFTKACDCDAFDHNNNSVCLLIPVVMSATFLRWVRTCATNRPNFGFSRPQGGCEGCGGGELDGRLRARGQRTRAGRTRRSGGRGTFHIKSQAAKHFVNTLRT